MSTSDNKILDWALDVLSGSPPLQNVVAFVVVLLLAAPLIRAGWREFKKPPVPPAEVVAIVKVEAAWLYTQLINMELELRSATERLAAIERLLRRRAKQNSSKRT